MWGVIAGSGFEKSDHVKVLEELDRATPFGEASSGLKRVELNGAEFLLLPRHGAHHELLPSEVNYRANVFALKRFGATRILSLSTIGSLCAEIKPGEAAVPRQFIDRTKGIRRCTFSGDGIVGHVSLAHPTCETCAAHAREVWESADCVIHYGQTYVCIEGPAFSTKAESHCYRDTGAKLIGMTAFPEYALVREAGMCYLPCCFVSDFDCWDDAIPHVTIGEILDIIRANNAKAYKLAAALISSEIQSVCECSGAGLCSGLMTAREQIPARHREWFDIICR